MANTLLTPTIITREALRILHQKCNFVSSIAQYDDRFAQSGAKIGSTLTIRRPNEFTVATGVSLSAQDLVEPSTVLTVSTQKHVDFTFQSSDLALTVDDFSERYIAPAMSVLAAVVEADAMSMFLDVYNAVDNTGATLSYQKLLNGKVLLDRSLTPMDGKRRALLNPQDEADLIAATSALFNSQPELADQYTEGAMGRAAGFKFFQNTSIPTSTTGTAATITSYLINNANTLSGATITVDGGSTTWSKGDVFTIAGVFSIHPETKTSTGILKQFVITSAHATVTTIDLAPSIVAEATGYQNVSTGLANNATLVKIGTASSVYKPSVLYHPDAFCFATADLEDVSKFGAWGARKQQDGISLRIARQYDINSDRVPCRIDILYGYKTIRAQLAARLLSN